MGIITIISILLAAHIGDSTLSNSQMIKTPHKIAKCGTVSCPESLIEMRGYRYLINK